MPEPAPPAALGEPRSAVRWAPAALALCIGVIVTMAWVRADHFLDREEAQHVVRALETEAAAFGTTDENASAHRLFVARMDQSKPWYGWPYYLVVATIWRLTGDSYDTGVLCNLLFLAAAVVFTGLLAARSLGPRAGPPAALFLASTPGALLWAHLFSPTLFLLALLAGASWCVVRTEGWSRPTASFVAGLVCAVATMAKVSLTPMWLAVAAFVTWRARRQGMKWHGLAMFGAGFLPALVSVLRNHKVLAYWGWQNEVIYAASSWSALAIGVVRRYVDALLLPHLLLALVAAAYAMRQPRLRKRIFALIGWAAIPAITVVILLRNSSTSREYVIAALPLALVFGSAVATAPRSAARAATTLLLLFVPLLALVGFFGVFVAPEKTHGWLGTPVDGGPWGIRHVPYPDLVGTTVAALRAAVPPGTPSRCDCLQVRPYPLASTDPGPVIAFDSRIVGPENVAAVFALAHRPLPWRVGFVPYALSCGAYRTALACVDAVVVAPGPLAGDIPGSFFLVTDRRQRLSDWGELARRADLGSLGTLEIRVPTTPALCPLGEPHRNAVIARRIVRSCRVDDYYASFLLAQLTSAGDDPDYVVDAMRLADQRAHALQAHADPSALLFGELGLARAARAALSSKASKGFDSTPGRP